MLLFCSSYLPLCKITFVQWRSILLKCFNWTERHSLVFQVLSGCLDDLRKTEQQHFVFVSLTSGYYNRYFWCNARTMPHWKSYFDNVSVYQSIWVFHIWMAYGISYYNETQITEVQTKRAYVKSLYGSMHPYPDIYFPDMNSYWTYEGSLTTPPLSENVTWLISQNIMGLSEKQVSMVTLWKHAIQGNQGSLLILQLILTVSYTINLFYHGQSIHKVSFFEGQNSYLRTAASNSL